MLGSGVKGLGYGLGVSGVWESGCCFGLRLRDWRFGVVLGV